MFQLCTQILECCGLWDELPSQATWEVINNPKSPDNICSNHTSTARRTQREKAMVVFYSRFQNLALLHVLGLGDP